MAGVDLRIPADGLRALAFSRAALARGQLPRRRRARKPADALAERERSAPVRSRRQGPSSVPASGSSSPLGDVRSAPSR